MKNQKGITLIALVITIIVLLILAGVSIAMLTGENGLLNRASQGATETKEAEIAERINVELMAIQADVMADNLGSFEHYGAEVTKIDNNLGTNYTVTPIPTALTSTTTKITITYEEGTLKMVGSIEISNTGRATIESAEKI